MNVLTIYQYSTHDVRCVCNVKLIFAGNILFKRYWKCSVRGHVLYSGKTFQCCNRNAMIVKRGMFGADECYNLIKCHIPLYVAEKEQTGHFPNLIKTLLKHRPWQAQHVSDTAHDWIPQIMYRRHGNYESSSKSLN